MRVWLGVWTLACLFAVGCGGGGEAEDLKKEDWTLTLTIDGQPVSFPLERMDIMLTEQEDKYPETFNMYGESLSLVGEFPLELHVGYETEYKRLIGKRITIQEACAVEYEEQSSYLTLPEGRSLRVLSGVFVVDRISGKYVGRDGDLALWGRITLQIATEAGSTEISGEFVVHPVTWG